MSEEKGIWDSIVNGTIVSGVIGGLGMCCRLLLSNNKDMTIWIGLRHILAATIMAMIVGHAVKSLIIHESARYGIIGVAGYSAPEIFDFGLRWVKKQIEKLD